MGNPEAYGLPRSFPERDNLNFSFSGLKTAVRFFYEKTPHVQADPVWGYDLCASFQKAIVDVLVRKSIQAVMLSRVKRLVASGGVLCNGSLRSELEAACKTAGIELILASPAFCTDNAAMIAGTAAEKMEAGIEPQIADDINPNLDLFTPEPHRDLARGLGRAMQLKNRKTKEILQDSGVGAAREV